MITNESIKVIYALNKQYIDENIDSILKIFGSNIKFESDIWFFDKKTDSLANIYSKKINFNIIPHPYRSFVKYYVIVSFKKLSSAKSNVGNMARFFEYLVEYEGSLPLIKVNQATITRYRRFVDSKVSKTSNKELSKSTKVKYLQAVTDFFWKLSGWEEVPENNPVNRRLHTYKRKKSDNEIKTRSAPDDVAMKLDKLLLSEEVPLYFKLYYLFIRLYPSRCSEISSLPTGCIKPLGDLYVFLKGEEKSSNDLGELQLLSIYIRYEGIGKHLIDLYYRQKVIAEALQDKVKDEYKGLLFVYNPITRRYGEPKLLNRICLVNGTIFNRYLKKICREKNIVQDNSDVTITTHSFRHNAITDRLYENFSTTAIRDMTGQKSDGEVIGSYHYRKKDEIKKLQEKSLRERFSKMRNSTYEALDNKQTDKSLDLVNSKVMFRGRIMNLDENREQKILANKRAYRVSYSDKCIGICTEIASCKSGVFDCFKCDDFAPDSNELEFFKEQLSYWGEKVNYFQIRGNQLQMEHAIEVKGLFEAIVRRIKDIIDKEMQVKDNEKRNK